MADPKAARLPAGDDYGDLVDAIARGSLPAPAPPRPSRLSYADLRREFSVRLGPWDRMIAELLDQLEQDAGSAGRGLSLLGVSSPEMVRLWLERPTVAAHSVTATLAAHSRYIAPVHFRRKASARGETYADLAESVWSFRARGDGELDVARLRPRYVVRLRPSWVEMVADLLGAVVADAGGVEYAATVLGVEAQTLMQWVLRLISRGSHAAARSTWAQATVVAVDVPYLDLVEAIERGALRGDGVLASRHELVLGSLRNHYTVKVATWARMKGELLRQIVAEIGSVRQAAQLLAVPRSTLGAWVRVARQDALGQGRRIKYGLPVKSRPIHELVSENLHRIAEQRGVGLAELADLVGIDRREFLAVLAGEVEGDLDWLNKVAAALGVDTAALVVDRFPERKG